MIGLIDYGAGNLRSVKKALDYLKVKNCLIQSGDTLVNLDKLIFPGVGAFQACIEELKSRHLFDKILEWIAADRPLLAICVGMQALFASSEESPGVTGLDILPGAVKRFQHPRVPQIGWNQIQIQTPSPLLKDIPDGSFFYFLHSYYLATEKRDIVIAQTEYGISYPVIIQQNNTFAVQFHPEKSADNGLKLLKNWVEL